ncbi:hypothetical protein PAT3040_04174 [Paenibacillus agaridevorans]|uniref:Uncharacterized protein n=1 Tax=Paenibacillus agaridevorans TaxID=171404 RepID=A0A2R5F1D7_9BACL|nr:hypothetical protein [Paenibacillus agaridevorans]GBG09524.1 hypothetical protein PAT3040_04174 [Paenibacillus agaridevorans]
MNYIPRRLYYLLATGKIIVDTGEARGETLTQTTVEQDLASYIALAERVPETIGMIQLEYGQYAEDFAQCNGYQVDPDTEQVLFSYPNPSEPEVPPVYRPPLSVEVDQLRTQLALVQTALDDLILGGAL